MTKCRREPDHVRWPNIVYDHFAEVTGHTPQKAAVDDEELAARICVQVVPPLTTSVAGPEALRARPIASDMDTRVPVAELVLNRPDRLTPVDKNVLVGSDIDALWSIAHANTAAEPIDRQSRIKRDDVVIEVLEGDSMFVASKIGDMSRLVVSEIGEAPFGVMVAIPNRHTLAFHRLTKASTVLANAHILIDFAADFARCTTDPVTHEIFYWYDGQMQQLTRTDDKGVTELHITGAFDQVFREMP
ncbi:hypothetical protein ACQPXH_20385 [Nocardia sp. CA-135953]|uniref:hypothetical protein n=1 Tax=Nocardia sp. CA-135953 TaxID=3239978 RepID=UPI003D95ACB3